MEKEQIKELIGSMGEEITGEYLGPRYVKSPDKYDSEKDGMFEKLKVEIKTSTRIYNTNEFIYEASQFFKLTNVDLFYINEIPLNPEDGITTYLCTNNQQLKLERRYFEGKYDLYVVVKFDKLLKVNTLKNDPRVDRLVELADKLSPFRREKKSTPLPVEMNEFLLSDEFFILDLPKIYNGDTISNIFSSHYKNLSSDWKKSGKKLKIIDGETVVAIIESYATIMKNARAAKTISQYQSLWLPTGLLSQQGLIKLFDHRFKKTQKFGDIPVMSYSNG